MDRIGPARVERDLLLAIRGALNAYQVSVSTTNLAEPMKDARVRYVELFVRWLEGESLYAQAR